MSTTMTPVEQYTNGLRPQTRRPTFQVRRPDGSTATEQQVMEKVAGRLRAAKQDRSKYEADWLLAMKFLEGQQWVRIRKSDRRVLDMRDDPAEKHREHHTENVLTSYYLAALGQIMDDDLMPALLARKDQWDEAKFAEETNLAYRYAYDEELHGDEVLAETFASAVGLGTGLVQCRFVKGRGQSYGEWPVHPDTGKLVVGEPGRALVAQAQEQGQTLRMQELRGEIEWVPLLPWNLLVPPGVPSWRRMPWFFIVNAVPVDQLRAEFPDRAEDIQEQNLSAIDAGGLRTFPNPDATGRLEGYALHVQMYEAPTTEFPDARVVHTTGGGDILLGEDPRWPYTVAGAPHSGVTTFRYRTVPGRWWGRGLCDDAIPVQIQRNRARSQHIEWKDRNLGRVYAYKGTITEQNQPKGKIRELIEVLPGMQFPQETTPQPNGPIESEIAMLDQGMDSVTGISKVSALSSAPANVAAYSAFAFFKQQDDQRNKSSRVELYRSIRDLTRVTLCAIKDYWPAEKEIAIANDEGGDIASFVFRKAKMPAEIYVQIGKGQSHPSDPAALTQLTFDLFDRGVSSGQPQPLNWLLNSVKAGKPLPINDDLKTVQRDKAEYENLLMAQLGTVPPVAPYDDDQLHIQIHRAEESTHALDPSPEAQMIVQRVEQHLQMHEQSMQQKAAQQIAAQTPTAQGPLGQLGGAPETGPQGSAAGGPQLPQVPAAAQAMLGRLTGQQQ